MILPGQTKSAQQMTLRSLKANSIGKLATVKGVVVRVGGVRPMVQIVSYVCQSCGFEVFQAVHSDKYTPMTTCPSIECTSKHVKGELVLNHKACK